MNFLKTAGADVFAHAKSVAGRPSFDAGDRVVCQVEIDPRGWRAVAAWASHDWKRVCAARRAQQAQTRAVDCAKASLRAAEDAEDTAIRAAGIGSAPAGTSPGSSPASGDKAIVSKPWIAAAPAAPSTLKKTKYTPAAAPAKKPSGSKHIPRSGHTAEEIDNFVVPPTATATTTAKMGHLYDDTGHGATPSLDDFKGFGSKGHVATPSLDDVKGFGSTPVVTSLDDFKGFGSKGLARHRRSAASSHGVSVRSQESFASARAPWKPFASAPAPWTPFGSALAPWTPFASAPEVELNAVFQDLADVEARLDDRAQVAISEISIGSAAHLLEQAAQNDWIRNMSAYVTRAARAIAVEEAEDYDDDE